MTYSENKLVPKFFAWGRFIWERFPPFSNIPMVLVFSWAHIAFVQKAFIIDLPWHRNLAICLITVLFLFKLRLYDEIKDYETDLVINPRRPLPRGLLKHSDIYLGIVVCIIAELGLATFASPNLIGFPSILVAIGYSLLMFKEFFIGKWIRPLLTTYALSHTFVTFFLSLSLIGLLTQGKFSLQALFFALNSWFIFNLFEFSRKSFVACEEIPHVESYSKVWTPFGAALLSSSMGWLSYFALKQIPLLFILNILYLILALLYAKINKTPWGLIFRSASGIFMMAIYLIYIFYKD